MILDEEASGRLTKCMHEIWVILQNYKITIGEASLLFEVMVLKAKNPDAAEISSAAI